MRGARVVALAALSLAGCARSCAGPFSRRTVAERRGDGWRAEVVCDVSTHIAVSRGNEPLLRGCRVSGTARVQGRDGLWSEGALAGAFAHHRDCNDARRHCASMRAEIVDRGTATGRVVALAPTGANRASVFAVTASGAVIRYPEDLARGGPREAVAAAPDPETLALTLARAGRLGPRVPESWARELEPVFTDAFITAHHPELLALARRCELRGVLVRRLLAAAPDATFETLFRAAYLGPEPWCAEVVSGLRAAPERLVARIPGALETLATQRDVRREATLLLLAGELEVAAARPAIERALEPIPAVTEAHETRWRFNTAVWSFVRIGRASAVPRLGALLRAAPALTVAPRAPEPLRRAPSTTLVQPAQCVADALMTLWSPEVRAVYAAIAADAALPATTRALASTALVAPIRDGGPGVPR